MAEILPMLYEEFMCAKKHFVTNSLIYKVCEDAIVKIKNILSKINGTYLLLDRWYSLSSYISLTGSERLSFEFDLGKSMHIKADSVMLSGKHIKMSDDNIL